MRTRVAASLCAGVALAACGGEPSLELRLAAGDAIAPGSVAAAGTASVVTLDIVLSGGLAEIALDTVELNLDENPIIGFARTGRTLTGIRLVVDRSGNRHPHLAMAGESRLRFAARGLDGNRYRGEFVVRVAEGSRGVQLLSGPDPSSAVLEASEPKALTLEIAITSDPGVSRDRRSWRLVAEVRDGSGIRAVAVELNWKLYERVLMHSGFPSRQRGEFRKAPSLPGSVTGESRHLVLDIPVPLRKRETRVELRATNLLGLEASESVTIRIPDKFPRGEGRLAGFPAGNRHRHCRVVGKALNPRDCMDAPACVSREHSFRSGGGVPGGVRPSKAGTDLDRLDAVPSSLVKEPCVVSAGLKFRPGRGRPPNMQLPAR